MKKLKVTVTLILVTAIVMSIFVGCGKTPDSSSNGSTPAQNSTQAAATPDTKAEPTKLWYAAEEVTYADGRVDLFRQQLLEKYNIDLKWDFIARTNYEEKLNVMIASDSFPDVIDTTGIARLSEAADAGLLIPLTDVKNNDENWKNIDSRLLLKYIYKNDIYALATNIDYPTAIYYREDWFKKLGLKMPATPEELYTVLKAFSENDPDGNGKDDTFGLVMNSSYGQTQPIWYMFLPASPFKDNGFYYDEKDKTLKNSLQLKDDMTAALTWLKKLYDEKILDNEFVLTPSEEEENKFVTGKSGTWLKGLLWTRQAKLQANFPDASMIIFPAIQGKYGGNLKQTPTGKGLYLTRAAKDKADAGKKTIAFLTGPEGRKLIGLGIEGVTYKIENGDIAWTNPKDAESYSIGGALASPFKVLAPVSEDKLKNDPVMRNVEIAGNYEIPAAFDISANETYKKNGADMKKVITEGLTKIIIGDQPMSYLDTILSELNKLGLDTICKETTEQMNK